MSSTPRSNVAKAFGSHVAGVYVRPDPSEVLPYLGEGVSAGVIQEIMDASREASNRAAAVARGTLDRLAKAAGASTDQTAQAGDRCLVPGARRIVGRSYRGRGAAFGPRHLRYARRCEGHDAAHGDGVGVDQRTQAPAARAAAPAAIVGAKVAIGWDGGAAAAHAVAAAIPMLARARGIEIINVTSGPIDTVQMDRLRDYLRLHGLAAVEHGINPGGQSTASALVDAAQRAGAGLLVIGGYGHSRLRELVLGGVTRHVFANVTMPILMAH